MTPQDNNPHDAAFDTVKNLPDLRAWLMRAYFNPTKHSKEPYYTDTVTKETVLSYISVRSNKFPQTSENVVALWNILPSLRDGLRSLPDEESAKEEIYTKGNETLANIGKAIGGVTPTMVNKISEQATAKLGAMLRALNSDKTWLAREAHDKIEDAFLSVAESYTDAVKEANNAQQVLTALVSSGVLQFGEGEAVDEIEKAAFEDVIAYAKSGATQAEIESVFLEDLNRPISIFLSMQFPVSRTVFPPAKRGRPKKETE